MHIASLAAALRAQGRRYRVIGRSQSSLERTFGDDPLAELVTWNPDDGQTIRQSLRGASAIVYEVCSPTCSSP